MSSSPDHQSHRRTRDQSRDRYRIFREHGPVRYEIATVRTIEGVRRAYEKLLAEDEFKGGVALALDTRTGEWVRLDFVADEVESERVESDSGKLQVESRGGDGS